MPSISYYKGILLSCIKEELLSWKYEQQTCVREKNQSDNKRAAAVILYT